MEPTLVSFDKPTEGEGPLIPLFLIGGICPVFSTAQEGFKLSRITESMAYIIDAKGWNVWSHGAISSSYISVKDLDELPSFKNTIYFGAKKIPQELFQQVVGFFTEVYDKWKTEAVGYLYYHKESGEWDFVPPIQTATSGSTHHSHGRPDEAPSKADGWLLAGTIHSHGSMAAFHSSTDDKDELDFNGVHITVGKVNTSTPEFACSVVANKARAKFELGTLVEGFRSTKAPDEWLLKMREDKPKLCDHADKDIATIAHQLYAAYLADSIPYRKYKDKLEKLQKRADRENEVKKGSSGSSHGGAVTYSPGSSSSSYKGNGNGQTSFFNGANRHHESCRCEACKLLKEDRQSDDNKGKLVEYHDGYSWYRLGHERD